MAVRWTGTAFWVIVTAINIAGPCVRATVVEGKLPLKTSFSLFTTKFCYDFIKNESEATVGEVRLELKRLDDQSTERPVPLSGRLLFLIFDDEKRKNWTTVLQQWETSSCEAKKDAAADVLEVRLESGHSDAFYQVHIREKVRPRFWYFGLVACDVQIADQVHYRVHLTNDLWGWQSEFSLDHMGLFALYAVSTAAFGLATAATAYAARMQQNPDSPPLREHPYMQLLLLSYGASLASCALLLAHYSLFARDGVGSNRIRFLGDVASTVANCTIFLIAMLASTGWAITNFAMQNRRCFLGMIFVVGGISTVSELRAASAVDSSDMLPGYQNGPGVLALVIKIFIFCWFAYQTKSTYEEELNQRLRRFYKFLGISITGWSLNMPVTVLLAFALSPWVRCKIVITVDVIARLLGQLLLSQLFCGPLSPITAANTFPLGQDSLEVHFGDLSDGRGPG